jgi:hypothetical protein
MSSRAVDSGRRTASGQPIYVAARTLQQPRTSTSSGGGGSSGSSSSTAPRTAQYDASRGGVVTSDGRFFPTSNPNFTPSGYTRVAPKTTTTPLPSGSGSRAVPSGRLDARGQPIMIPFRDTPEFRQAQPITRTQRTQAQRLGLSNQEIDTIVSRQGTSFLNQVIRRGQLREQGFYDAKQKRRIMELTRRASTPQEAQALLRAVTRPSLALQRKVDRDVSISERVTSRPSAETTAALLRGTTKVSPGVEKKLQALAVRDLPYLSPSNFLNFRSLLNNQRIREQLERATNVGSYKTIFGNTRVVRVNENNQVVYYTYKKDGTTLRKTGSVSIQALRVSNNRLQQEIRNAGTLRNYARKVITQGVWGGFVKPLTVTGLKVVYALSPQIQAITKASPRAIESALGQAVKGKLSDSNKKKLEKFNKSLKNLPSTAKLTKDEKKLVGFIVILTAVAVTGGALAGVGGVVGAIGVGITKGTVIVGKGIMVGAGWEAIKDPSPRNVGRFLGLVSVGSLFNLAKKLKGNQKQVATRQLKRTETQLNARLTKLQKKLLTSKRPQEIKSLKATIKLLKRAITRVKVTRIHINKPMTKAEFTKRLETLKKQLTKTKKQRVEAIQGKKITTSKQSLKQTLEFIKNQLKNARKLRLTRTIINELKSLFRKGNNLKTSFNRIFSKKIRDVRKIEKLIAQEQSLAKQIVDLKKLKPKPIKPKPTFISKRVVRAKSVIRQLVGRKSVRTLTKAQRKALTRKYGKTTFDEALRELAAARIAKKILLKKRVSALRRATKVKKPIPIKKTIQQRAIERVRKAQQAKIIKIPLSKRTVTVKDIIKEPPIGTNQATAISKQGTVQILRTVSKTKKIIKKVKPVRLLTKTKVKVKQIQRLQLIVLTEQKQRFKFIMPVNIFKTLMSSILLNRQRIISKVVSKQDVSMDAMQAVGTVTKQEVAQATDVSTKQLTDVMPAKITLPQLRLRLRQITKKIPELDIPDKPIDWTKKELTKRYKKFDVYLKKRGSRLPYMRANSGWLTFKDARNFGRYVSDHTPLASYQIRPSRLVGKRQKFTKTSPDKKFRRVKAKSKLPRKTVVEKRKYRLDKPGETRGISVKGLRKLRSQKNILNLIKGKKPKKIKKIIKRRKKRAKRGRKR